MLNDQDDACRLRFCAAGAFRWSAALFIFFHGQIPAFAVMLLVQATTVQLTYVLGESHVSSISYLILKAFFFSPVEMFDLRLEWFSAVKFSKVTVKYTLTLVETP